MRNFDINVLSQGELLSASLIRVTVATRAQRHGGHPEATGSKHFDR
jgi:hypothetical protein